MKIRYLLLTLGIGICGSCTHKKAPDDKAEEAVARPVTEKVYTLPQTAAILDGSWISQNYVDNMEKYKSVYNNTNYDATLLTLSFVKDSIVAGKGFLYGYNNQHLNSAWPVYWNDKNSRLEYDSKQNTGDKPPGDFYIIPVADNVLELQFVKTGKKETYKKSYIEDELNILFTGTYTDAATGAKVTFTEDGQIKGLPGYVSYFVQYNPDEEDSVPFDALFLYAKTTDEAGKPFHFKIKGNTLTLYNVDEHEVVKYAEYTYTIGKEAFVLTKQ